jgi:hypothetical protein
MGGAFFRTETRETLPSVVLVIGILAIIATLGVAFLARHRGRLFVTLLCSTVPMLVLAAALGAYPISLRLVLFIVPVLFVLVAAGIGFAVRSAPPARAGRLLVVARIALLARPLVRGAVPSLQAYQRQELRPLVRHVEASAGKDPIYVFASAIPAWLFYTTDWTTPDHDRLTSLSRIAGADGPAFENTPPEWHRIPANAAELEYAYQGHRELFGVSTGEHWRPVVGPSRTSPAPGWAEREARRIAEAASPRIWLVFSHYRGTENELFDEIERLGLVQEYAERTRGAHIFRYGPGAPAGAREPSARSHARPPASRVR